MRPRGEWPLSASQSLVCNAHHANAKRSKTHYTRIRVDFVLSWPDQASESAHLLGKVIPMKSISAFAVLFAALSLCNLSEKLKPEANSNAPNNSAAQNSAADR